MVSDGRVVSRLLLEKKEITGGRKKNCIMRSFIIFLI